MHPRLKQVVDEIGKVIVGKDDVVEKVLIAVLAQGHVLLDDVPGVGKTTLAATLGKVIGFDYGRVQFTPDVLPSDINGFTMYNRAKGVFQYVPGILTRVNLLLCDEINRTSSKTQSALLEAMEEHQVTVDGATYRLRDPFIVIATQNNVGSVGTQLLPHAQLDRFAMKLSLGYPDFQSQKAIIRDRQQVDPATKVQRIATREEVMRMQQEVKNVEMVDSIIDYITALTFATRGNELLDLGLSPRAAIVLSNIARAHAYLDARMYVIPEDIIAVFNDVCSHRVIVSQKARSTHLAANDIMQKVLRETPVPNAGRH